MRQHYLVIDLEATCCDDNSIPRSQTEIIEIGAVMVEPEGLRPVDEFVTFVKPQRHPQLHPFCTQLTSIVQEQVDQAPTFRQALDSLNQWKGKHRHLFCSWGGYDARQFKRECQRNGLPYPFSNHLNLKEAFAEKQGLPRALGMAGALQRAGLVLDGTHHRGIDDARNMVRLLPFIFGEQIVPGGKKARPLAR